MRVKMLQASLINSSSRAGRTSRKIAAIAFNRCFSSSSSGAAKSEKLFWSRDNIPVFALTIGAIAFCFQVTVLYPWHHVLSKQIDALEVMYCV